MADIEAENASWKRTAKDLTSGAAGGIAQVLLGESRPLVRMIFNPGTFLQGEISPLPGSIMKIARCKPMIQKYINVQQDSLLVRLQTTTTYPSALSCASSILKNEGPLAFYKGTLTPLLGIGACVSVQFGGFHYARRAFEERNLHSRPKGSPTTLTYSQYYASGAFAGITNTVLSTPIEHVRIRLQAQPHGAGKLYSGPLDCIRKLSAHNGFVSGLYRGTSVTLLREAQAYGVWFLTFEYLMNLDMKRNNYKRSDISTLKIAFYGGLAGEMLWISSYPFDVIKSKMQTDGFGKDQRFKNMRDCFAQTWAKDGMRGFWKGIIPTLVRAMPVSAGTFAVAELTMRLMG